MYFVGPKKGRDGAPWNPALNARRAPYRAARVGSSDRAFFRPMARSSALDRPDGTLRSPLVYNDKTTTPERSTIAAVHHPAIHFDMGARP